MMKLSIIIPSFNEAENLPSTLSAFHTTLSERNIDHELIVVDDHSGDNTQSVLKDLSIKYPTIRYITNHGPNGIGNAIRKGFEIFTGDCVALVMADLSDSPEDLVRFYDEMLRTDCDCVFGSRFIKGGTTIDYPFLKLAINRLANNLVRICFGFHYNDCTNAFKMYRKETINGLQPFISPHFNLLLELPLKAIVRGYSYSVVPNSWTNRKHGISKLKIREMGSRYAFILLYCLIEKFFSRGDFSKKRVSVASYNMPIRDAGKIVTSPYS